MKKTLQAKDVNRTIEQMISKRERRITELQTRQHVGDAITIGKLEHAICTLIELQHILQLCDCPPEAYKPLESEDHAINS